MFITNGPYWTTLTLREYAGDYQRQLFIVDGGGLSLKTALEQLDMLGEEVVPVLLDTPLYRCEALEPALGCAVSIKLETANPVHSFTYHGWVAAPS